MANPNMNHVVSQSATFISNGRRVGSVQSVSPSENLTTVLIRELDADIAGEIIEIGIGVPSYTLGLAKFMLYQETFFAALGYVVRNIGDITDPMDLQVAFKSGKTGNTVAKTFVGGVLKSLSSSVNIGTILITENGTFDVRTII